MCSPLFWNLRNDRGEERRGGRGGAEVHDGELKNDYIDLLLLPSCAAYMYDFFCIVSENTFFFSHLSFGRVICVLFTVEDILDH